jgi:hypothetical protein
MSTDADNSNRGRFPPGRSGNPAGKAPGTRNALVAALDRIGAEAAENVLRAAVKAAIGDEKTGGDLRAAELILSRVWPVRKGRPLALALPAMQTAADLPAALGAVVAAVAAGDLTTDEGAAVASILEAHRRSIETADLESRVAALEASHARD